MKEIKTTRQQINALCRDYPQFRVMSSYNCYPNEKCAFLLNMETNKFVYVHTYPDMKRDAFLIRSAESAKDYVGGTNFYPKTEEEYFKLAMKLTK